MSLLRTLEFLFLATCALFTISDAAPSPLSDQTQNLLVPVSATNDEHVDSAPALTYIPPIGLGLWNSKDLNATNAVRYAFRAGYHHLDSAAAYRNEDFVGKGIALSGLPRSSFWITSKLWNSDHSPADVRPALEKTLSQLDVPYLDLYLIHWPVAQDSDSKIDESVTILDTWRAMEDLVRAGLTKNIGVSNFAKHDVEDLLEKCEICPIAHEFETHPYLQQTEFVKWHRTKGIQVIAYSPLANINPTYDTDLKPILEDPFWMAIAKEKRVSPAQAILAWGMQRGTIVIPKSIHEHRIYENLFSQYVRFNDSELELIAQRDKKVRFNNPSHAWGVDLFDDLD